MEALKKLYGRALDGVGDMGSFKSDWRWVLLYSLCVYAAVLALRLSFAGRWDHPELWAGGERIMATHDSYFWLAKARGVGTLGSYPLARFAATLSAVFGISLGTIGFWLPAFAGALVGVGCYLWGWLLGGRNAGLMAGAVGSLTPGFFYRSRLGYFDTDMFTLLAPLLVTWMLAYWLSGYLRRGWFPSVPGQGEPRGENPLWQAWLFGLLTRVLCMPHLDIVQFSILSTIMAFFLAVVMARPGKRVKALYGLTAFWLAAFPGSALGILHFWPISLLRQAGLGGSLAYVESGAGILVGLIIVLAYGRGEKSGRNILDNPKIFYTIMAASLLVALNMTGNHLSGTWQKLIGYFSAATKEGSVPVKEVLGPVYPSILQSIIEARQIPVGDVLARGAYSAWLGYLSLAATAVVVALRPAAAFLLPLVMLHLLSFRLGVRFTMFGGAALMVCLGVGVYWLCAWIAAGKGRKALITGVSQVVIGIGFLAYCHSAYSTLALTPVISREHAEALLELGKRTDGSGRVWTWWDWGYASQYYAGYTTVADGGRHAGRDVFPVGYVMSTHSPYMANRMVVFSAQYPAEPIEIGLNPANVWDGIPRSTLPSALEAQLSDPAYPSVPPQYLVVSWKDLLIAKWITYFGNWNLQTGVTTQASVGSFLPGQLGINPQRGAVMNRQGGGGLVKDIVMLDKDGAHAQHFFMNSMSPQLMPTQQHLVVNKVTGESVLMDRTAYRSMMVRLLVDDPSDPEIAKYFKIVVDKLPFARIYEVIQNVK